MSEIEIKKPRIGDLKEVYNPHVGRKQIYRRVALEGFRQWQVLN